MIVWNNIFKSLVILSGIIGLVGCNSAIQDDGTYVFEDSSSKVDVPSHNPNKFLASFKAVNDYRNWVTTGSNGDNVTNYWITIDRDLSAESKDNTIGYLFVNMFNYANVISKVPMSIYLKSLVQDALNEANISNQENLEITININDLWISHCELKNGYIEGLDYKYDIDIVINNNIDTNLNQNIKVANKYHDDSTIWIVDKEHELSDMMFNDLYKNVVEKLKQAK